MSARHGWALFASTIALLLGLARPVPAASEAARPDRPSPGTAAEAEKATSEKTWNRVDLIEHFASVGGPESRWDELASVRSFEKLQRALEELRQLVLHDAQSEQEAAEGLRMLLKVFAMSTDDTFQGDFRIPLFKKLDTRWRDVGAYNPDAEYDQAWIDGRFDYELSGNLGSARYVSVTVNGSSPTASSTLVAYLDDATIRKAANAAGDFTISLAHEKPRGAGLFVALPDGADGVVANGVVTRQYLADRAREPLATFSIRAVGKRLPPAGPMPESEIANRIAWITNFLVVNSTWHRTLMPYALEKPNQFFDRAGTALGANVANSENLYHMAYYQIARDEALVIDFEPPKSPFWNLTRASLWHESERFLTDPVSRTLAEVTPQKDGRIRFVLAHEDPGVPNWLDSFEHERGFLIFRMVGVAANPLPKVQKVKSKDLASLD